ncbi:MAG: VanZ family protein [Mollicutes bacterium]|nr:VanZ family protein [Mollicutes bacterium]
MLRASIISILEEIGLTIFLICFGIELIRFMYLIAKKKKIIFYKEILFLGFVIYIVCLFYVVTFQDVNWSTSNYVPFGEMLRYTFGSKLFFKNVIGNMVMFLPYGFFISYFFKIKKVWIMFLLTLLTSLSIETTQSMIGRVFDIDDIILNLLGGIMGHYLYRFLDNIKSHLPVFLKKRIIYNIIMLGILVGIILYLLNIINIGV